jgi:hypothetical protein
MQTFLPYPSFIRSARCLDYKRLGKQRVECKQILNALEGRSDGWVKHPATQMWKGYENALKLYANRCIKEWVSRGYQNTMQLYEVKGPLLLPNWFGGLIHASHRANLLRKDFIYYSQFNWIEKSDMPYYWPTKENINVHS